MKPGPEFERFAGSYEKLLKDPIRDAFTAGNPEFFQTRKRDLIRDFFRQFPLDTRRLSYLDFGCGKGELATLLRSDFDRVCGCDLADGMLRAGSLEKNGIETRVQQDPARIPFADSEFGFVTAVCVYHHIRPPERPALTREIGRVLRPGGTFCLIEHNPSNPVTRAIVRRTPVDADAVLLSLKEARELVGHAGLKLERSTYFLYLPEKLYRYFGGLERSFARIPLGGQYALFATRPA